MPHRVSLVTIDVAFISLKHILPALPPFLEPHADIVALVKPQFEAGREAVGPGGVVRDPAARAAAVLSVARDLATRGAPVIAVAPSPIAGREGNREIFVRARKGGREMEHLEDAAREAAG